MVIDEQEMMLVGPQDEYIEAIKSFDWKNADLEELLSGISYDFPLSFRRTMLYQAIKMCRADGSYHDKEKSAVKKVASILGIDPQVVASLEALAEIEDSTEHLRFALFETAV